MDHDYQRDQLQILGGQFDGHADQERDDHHQLSSKNPTTARTQPVGIEQINERAHHPLPGPGEVKGADKDADFRLTHSGPFHLHHHRGGGETEGNSFRNVQEEKRDQPTPTRAE